MERTVRATLDMTIEAPARLAIQIGIANPAAYSTDEAIAITLDGAPMPWSELDAGHGGRLWLVDALPGLLEVSYYATLTGTAEPAGVGIVDELTYLRPSRYCESDRLTGFAGRHFQGITASRDVLAAVSSWVGTQLEYVAGSSNSADGAIDTLLSARGVCRDYAHLTAGLLRALEIPARVVAVYAPGLSPMDFHAVTEAFIDDAWYVVDATRLAPRQTLIRIATGRDAADTAFVSSYGGAMILTRVGVIVTSDDLPIDDLQTLVQLS